MPAGIPKPIRDLSLTFRYNDPDSLEHLFTQYPDQIACVMLEPAKYEDPKDHFLHRVQELCQAHGAVFILDEMITGFRWSNGGAQKTYDIVPDMSTFGKALANGFSLSALVGKRALLEPGGIYHRHERVFVLSTTHGAETHALAAGLATMRFYQQHPVIEALERQGTRLASGVTRAIKEADVEGHVEVIGRPCNLVFAAKDAEGKPSQGFRTLLMQELIERGVLGPSLVVSYAHSDDDTDRTVEAFRGALAVYRQALDEGYERVCWSVRPRRSSIVPTTTRRLRDRRRRTPPAWATHERYIERRGGYGDARLCQPCVPVASRDHRRWCAQDVRRDFGDHADRCSRGPYRNHGARLGGATGVAHS